MFRARRRAFLLILAITLVFVLLTLTLGLITSLKGSSLQRLTVLRQFDSTRAGLESEAAVLSAMRGKSLDYNPSLLKGKERFQAPGTEMPAYVTWGDGNLGTSRLDVPESQLLISSKLFDYVRQDPFGRVGYDDAALHTVLDGQKAPAQVSTVQARLPSGKSFTSQIAAGLPYAAYAPAGSIEIEGNLVHQVNPAIDTDFSNSGCFSEAFWSAVPVAVAARDNVGVEGKAPVARLYSAQGRITAPTGTEARSGLKVRDNFSQRLFQNIDGPNGAIAQLRARALDKTAWIVGKPLTPSGIYNMFTGRQNPMAIFSLEQACSFPLFPVPGIAEGEGYVAILFHVPYPPNFTNAINLKTFEDLFQLLNPMRVWKDAVRTVDDLAKTVEDLGESLGDLLEAAWDALTGDEKAAKKKYEEAKDRLNDAEKALGDAVNAVYDLIGGPLKDILNKIISCAVAKPPETTTDEELFKTFGWSYVEFVEKFITVGFDAAKALFDLIRGQAKAGYLDTIFEDFTTACRLVHFVDRGPTGNYDASSKLSQAQFTSDGGFVLCATWNVPRGRSLKWSSPAGKVSTFTVKGDLWVQRGATMVVEGNLVLKRPTPEEWAYNFADKSPPEEDDFFYPSGRILLEEGATLVVTGDLQAEGDETLGSLALGSRLGSQHPITSGLFCQGNLKLKHGTATGVAVDELLKYYTDHGLEELRDALDRFIAPFFQDAYAVAARFVGPFSTRKCWFADYCTTFVVIPELAEFLLQGPWPIPLMYGNCLPKLFDPLSSLYKVELNAVLGPNLVTQCSWWLLGPGCVPMVPKNPGLLEEAGVFRPLADASWDELSKEMLKETVDEFENEVLPTLVKDVINIAISTIINEIISEGIPTGSCGSGSLSPGKSSQSLGKLVEKVAEKIVDKVKERIKMRLGEALRQLLRVLRGKIREELSRGNEAGGAEQAGVLVYAGKSLEIGTGEENGTAAGLFLARGDIEIHCRRVLGSLISLTGNIRCNDLYFQPYFTAASLYLPPRANDYGTDVNVPESFQGMEEIFQDIVYPLTPWGGTPFDCTSGTAWVMGKGWRP